MIYHITKETWKDRVSEDGAAEDETKRKRRENQRKRRKQSGSESVARRPIHYLDAFPGFQSISVNGMLLGRSDRRDGGDELV